MRDSNAGLQTVAIIMGCSADTCRFVDMRPGEVTLTIGGPGTVPGKFWNAWIHVVPRLRAVDPNIGLRREPCRVVEARCLYAQEVGPRQTTRKQWGTASAAKFALSDISTFGYRPMLLALALEHTH